MQKMPITLIAILLFVQILSNGFAQLPNTSDEETLEVDLEMPSQASARNNHSTCGSSPTLTNLSASTDASTYSYGTTAYADYTVDCSVVGDSYRLDTTLSNGNASSSSSSWNWTGSNNSEYMSESWANLAVGNYCASATLWEINSNSTSYIDSKSPCFSVTNASTGGNNTGGNGTGGNNTENGTGNNTGGNNTTNHNDAHCLIVNNLTINSTYYVTIDLENTCSKDINYPGINATADHSGVSGFSNQTNWWYLIYANGTYNMSWQLSFDSTVHNGTNITLDFEAAILSCGVNGTWHDCPSSTLSYQFIFAGNNTGGNNTGGNNTGGNNTGGNNTGGNNTGGNNTGGNNTGGNNTGGNNTGGNNTGGNNTGGNNTGGNNTGGNNTGGNNTGGNNTGGNNTGGNNTGGNNTGGNNTGANNTGNNNGSSTVDSDNDGVVDSADLCPSTIVGSQVNANGCAPSQLDSDSDGIVDSFDLCPSTSAGTVVDQTGCAYSTGGNSSGNNSGSAGNGSSDSSDSESGGLPSVGVVGTIAAIGVGLIFTARREDEE